MKLDKIKLDINELKFSPFNTKNTKKIRIKINIADLKQQKVPKFSKIVNSDPSIKNFVKPKNYQYKFNYIDDQELIRQPIINLQNAQKPFMYKSYLKNNNNEIYTKIEKLTPSSEWPRIIIKDDKFNYKK